ncbi:EAL domain-containing protein [Thalassotalea euphylliae]|uniref:EAL domain-containing protein n=1 Tax=Thalassotalea euphylliae TaxID=1655234 RepID=A0A3E0U0F2_9GAMM|nr:EAL domain-containing protein [Thalassotalea euphylliae]
MVGGKLSKSIWLRYSFVCLLTLVIAAIGFAATQHLSTLDTRELARTQANIEVATSYYVDDSNQLSASQVREREAGFISSEPNDIPFELGDSAYWVRFSLSNQTLDDAALVLHIDNSMLTELAAYQYSSVVNSPLAALNQGTLSATAFPHLNINLSAKQNIELLLKLKAGGPPNIPLVWHQAEQFKTKQALTRVLFGVVIGVLAVIGLYNLVIFNAIRDKVYLIYIGYLLAAFLVLATVNGYGYILFSPETQELLNTHSLFFHYYLLSFLVLFTLYFLKFNEDNGKLFKIGQVSVYLLICLSAIGLFIPHTERAIIFFSLVPIYYAYSICLVILKLKSEFSWARYYVVSWIPLLVGAGAQQLTLFGYIDYSFILVNAFLLAVLCEITLMSFALAERMRRHEAERIAEMSYHSGSGIPRKNVFERSLYKLMQTPDAHLHVLVIKPEHIERVALYVNDAMNTALFKRIYEKLTPLFAYNDAIEPIGMRGEKIALVAGNMLAIVVNEQKNQQALDTIVSSINTLVEEAYRIEALQIPLQANIGVASYPEHGNLPFILLNKAQMALPDAENCTGKWAVYEEFQSDNSGYRLKLAAEINAAIEQGSFELYHQPQVDLKTMRVCGSECLIRWHYDGENLSEQGFIPPTAFIPVAEDMGLINKLTRWVIKQAIAQHSVLLAQGYKHHMVSINISGKDICAEGFYEYVAAEIEAAEIAANKIVFELTESATITNNAQALEVIELLTELGVTISIDDFGTGYASMAYVSELPFKELKVDRQFVQDVGDDKKRRTIAETTVRMAKGLGLEVVAEGINSQKDENLLRQFGCDIGQGYFYAKPMAFDDYLEWLTDEVNGRSPEPLEGEFISKHSLS